MREVITFQVGSYANFVGAHSWNLLNAAWHSSPVDADAEEDHGIWDMFFVDSELKAQPRVLAFDLRGSQTLHLPEELAAPAPRPPSIETWEGPTAVHQLGSGRVSAPGPAEGWPADAQGWDELMDTPLAPGSVVEVPDAWYGTLSPHAGFAEGESWLRAAAEWEDVADRVRRMAEPCDCLQGFQVFVDSAGAWAPLAARLAEHTADEYPRAPRWGWGWGAPGGGAGAGATARTRLSEALGFALASSRHDLWVPALAPPAGSYPSFPAPTADSWRGSSALLALAADTAVFPTRARGEDGWRPGFADCVHQLAGTPHASVAALGLAASRTAAPPPLEGGAGLCWLTPGAGGTGALSSSLADLYVTRGGTGGRPGTRVAGVRGQQRWFSYAETVPLPGSFPGQSDAQAAGGSGVARVGARLSASSAALPIVRAQQAALREAVSRGRSAPVAGLPAEDARELYEHLCAMEGAYAGQGGPEDGDSD